MGVYRKSKVIMVKRGLKKYWKIILSAFALMSIAFYFCLPKVLFDDPLATILNDKDGRLLSAKIAADGQWRFPEVNGLPEKYKTALLTFEDKKFYAHPGVDLLALGKAFEQNLKAGKVVRGGSTISMQLIRLHRKGKSRNINEKLIEIILALRLEMRYSKEEILNLYASHAPYGSNNVGINAASWRYFERPPQELSWAEAALLAVLPNQPSLLYPGRSNEALKKKRDRLLTKLYELGEMDDISLDLALFEPLPQGPQALPQLADHYLNFYQKENSTEHLIQSSIDVNLQKKVRQVLRSNYALLKNDGIHNASVLVLDVKRNEVLSYAGNISGLKAEHAGYVDLVQAQRSTGSLLKPFLYASLLNEGQILPKTLIQDIPSFYDGFAPKNFNRTYDGMVHADMALARSLNIPAVNMLKIYGYPKFHQKLKDVGIRSLNKPPGHYGLAMILGGAESSLWEMSNSYASMARTLSNFPSRPRGHRYQQIDWSDPLAEKRAADKDLSFSAPLNAASIWFTFDAMTKVYRPNEEMQWELFESSRKIAWKTGTSFGFRDGWAIGVTPEFVVGVWVGNADGEGRPGLTGIEAAAPIMFQVFDQLPETSWFIPPRDELTLAAVDRNSGYLASPYSAEIDTVFIPKMGLKTSASPFNKRVHLDAKGQFQVNANCYDLNKMVSVNWFELPPAESHYFKKKKPTYKEVPPFKSGCENISISHDLIAMLYPKNNATLYIPKEQDGELGKLIFEATHISDNETLHWHLDNQYLGETKAEHTMAIAPNDGKHLLKLIDEKGNTLELNFTVQMRAEEP